MDRSSLTALSRVADVPAAIALAFACYAVAIWAVVPEARVMPQGLERILEVQQHLAAGEGATGGVSVLGSSVVVEGVDCSVLAAQLPPRTRCENLAWTGGDPRQWLLLAPALRESPPRALALGLDLLTLLDPAPISPERLAIASWWRFVPGAEIEDYSTILLPEEFRVLSAARATQLLRFRTFPTAALNEYLREVARSDLRYEGYTQNFEAPWVRRRPASTQAMDKHLERTIARLRAGGTDRLAETEQALAFFVRRLRGSQPDTRIVLVLTPVHPRLAEALEGDVLEVVRRALATRARELSIPFLDHSLALPQAGFSDALHPFAAGRLDWSRELGEALATALR